MGFDLKKSKKVLQFLAGSAILIVGVACILVWWRYVVFLFKGGIGMVLALGGLVILAMVKDE